MGLRLATLLLIVAAGWSVASVPRRALAGGGPQNVAVIVNPNDPSSLEVANAYVELRKVPGCNVVYIPFVLDARSVGSAKFRDQIFKPAIAELTKRGVLPQIDAIAFSSGFPYLVDCSGFFGSEPAPQTSRPLTSLTSATFLFQFMEEDRKEMFLGNANFYFAPIVDGKSTSRAFSANKGWGPGGAELAAGGLKYYLATALGVTHGHGNSVAEIVQSLRRSKAADGAKYRGTIYYMQNNDVRSKVRHNGYQAAVNELATIGVAGVVMPGVVPNGKNDVAGLTTGTSHLQLRGSGSTLLPGALVDNLTSAGGQMLIRQETNPQTRISEFIRLGAAGASGAVVEPYAIATKFPSPDLHVHYARGCSLAESFYQSIAAPCHLLVIGDPLCQPWAVAPKVTVSGAVEGVPASGDVAISVEVAYPDARQASKLELFVDGVRIAEGTPGAPLTFPTKDFADGFHDVRVVAIDNTPIAVQGAWLGQIQVKNGRDALQLSATTPRAPLNGTVSLTVMGTSQQESQIFHNGRAIAKVGVGGGAIDIPAELIGRGRVELQAVQTGKVEVRSRPTVVEIY